MGSPELRIRQIEAFRALMLRRTVTRAAASLHISQPAVSRLIAELETRVGFSLFERQEGRLIATAEARSLYQEVERAFVGIDQIAQAAQQIYAMRRGSLRIAGSPAVALDFLPQQVATFINKTPAINVTLLALGSQNVIDMIASERCDLGFVIDPIPHPAVRLDRLSEMPMRCILPPGHRLEKKRVIRPADCAREPFVLFPSFYDARTQIDRLFVEHRVTLHTCVEAQLSQTIVSLVEHGAGIALIDPITAAFVRGRVAVRRFEPALPDSIYLARAHGQPASRLANAFAAHVRNGLAQLGA